MAIPRSDESGQGMAEYIIIVIIVAIAVILGLRYFGGSIFGQFRNATEEIQVVGKGRDKGESGSGGSPSGADTREHPATTREGGGGGAKGAAKSGSGSGGGDLPPAGLDEKVDELRTGVGDTTGSSPVNEIQISMSTLLTIAGVVVGLGVVIVIRSMRKKKKKDGGESGQAMVEFCLCAITFFFVILGVMQLAMVLNAYSLVRYAAYNAARAAIVHGGSQEKMEEAARLSLLATFPSHGRADTIRGTVDNYLGAKATDNLPVLSFFNEPITKVELIRRTGAEGVVTFDDPRDTPKAIITVKVTHLYQMVIPLVNRIIFRVFMMIKQEGGYQGQTVNQLSAETNQARRGGNLADKEFRVPLVGVYTMRMQSDLS